MGVVENIKKKNHILYAGEALELQKDGNAVSDAPKNSTPTIPPTQLIPVIFTEKAYFQGIVN